MVSIKTLESWKPSDLTGVADDLTTKRKTLLDLQDEVDGAKPPSNWPTEAGEKARGTHTKLRDRLNDMVAEVSDVIISVDTAASEIKTAKRTVEDQKGVATSKGFTVSESGGSVTVKAPAEVAEENPDADTQCSEIANAIATALSDAATADDNLKASLTAAANGTIDGGDGSLADASVQLPPELDGMSPPEMADYLTKNPELLDVEGMPETLTQHLGIDPTTGTTDGGRFADDPLQTRNGLARLSIMSLIAEDAQTDGETLTPDQAGYLRNFYDEADGSLLSGAETIRNAYIAESDSDQLTWMTRGLSNGALALTDPDLDGSANYFGQDSIEGDGDNNGLPEELYEAMHDQPELSHQTGGATIANFRVTMTGGDGFRSLSDFLAPSSLEGGEDFSRQYTEESADVASFLNQVREGTITYEHPTLGTVGAETVARDLEFDSDDSHEWSPYLEDAVTVASRNPDANVSMFEDAATDPALASRMSNLLTFDYQDDGHAASGYMDTINSDLASPPGSELHDRGVRGSAAAIDFLTSTPGHDGEGMNVFEELMRGAGDGSSSLGETNPRLVAELNGVISGNFGDLGLPADASDTTYADGHINANSGDLSRLFTLAHTNEDAGHDLNVALGAWEQTELDRAMAVKDDPSTSVDERLDAMTRAGTMSGQLDGLSTAGMYNQHLITGQGDYDTANDAYQEQLEAAELGKTAAGFGLGQIPVAGSFLSTSSGILMDELISQHITEPDAPSGANYENEGVSGNEQVNDRRAAYEYASALVRSGQDLPPEIEGLLDADGNLPAYGDPNFTNADREQLYEGVNHNDPLWEAYQEGYRPGTAYTTHALDETGSAEKGTVKDDDYLNGTIK